MFACLNCIHLAFSSYRLSRCCGEDRAADGKGPLQRSLPPCPLSGTAVDQAPGPRGGCHAASRRVRTPHRTCPAATKPLQVLCRIASGQGVNRPGEDAGLRPDGWLVSGFPTFQSSTFRMMSCRASAYHPGPALDRYPTGNLSGRYTFSLPLRAAPVFWIDRAPRKKNPQLSARMRSA